LPNIGEKAAAFHPQKHKSQLKEIDYFEAVFLLNIDKNTPLCSRAIFNLQAFHAPFGDEQKALTFQRITVIDKKLHLTSTCARKLEHVVFFCSFVVSKNHPVA